jgi:hypothetical protein
MAAAQIFYGSPKKPSVLYHNILIRLVFYHLKVILKISDGSIKKWLKKDINPKKSRKGPNFCKESFNEDSF